MTKKAVLKEYGAEIENLRLMLQATREKNGIYLDPAQFEAMESRLQSQESQLLECEGALRSRMDELKELRSQREDMENRLSSAQSSLEETSQQLDETTRVLQETTDNLLHTRVELAAADAVVLEQVQTECGLTEIGGELKTKVFGYRSDIDLLHDKVGRHASMECRRVADAESFRTEVILQQETLLSEVSCMKKKIGTESAVLCDGVGALLVQGKQTCSALQVAIDCALGSLVADAEDSKVKMKASCGALQTDLQLMGQSASAALQLLQGQLGAWIVNLEAGMSDVVKHLEAQHAEINSLASQVSRARENQTLLLEELSTEQRQMSAQVATQLGVDGEIASQKVQGYRSQQQSAAEMQHAFVRTKAIEIENVSHLTLF